jgi:hypothetical protein
MTCLCDVQVGLGVVLSQRSCAASLRAEKVETHQRWMMLGCSLQRSCAEIRRAEKGAATQKPVQPPNLVQPLFIEVGRRKSLILKAPSNLPTFLRKTSHVRVRVRTRIRASDVHRFKSNSLLLQNRLDKVGRWTNPMFMRVFTVQPLRPTFFYSWRLDG